MTVLRRFQSIKPVILSLAIVLGFVLHCPAAKAAETETAVLAGGCFWCVEADFEKLPGVTDAVSGYTGGTVADPTYRQVSRGGTGHSEAVQIIFDPDVITYRQILDLFLRSIDPLDDGGQFCDRGHTYAPMIFVLDDAQKAVAEDAVAQAKADLGRRIRVPIRDASTFYPAEEYHQDYYKQTSVVLTRFGPQSKADAYKKYRKGCGRDARVKAVWGDAGSFLEE
ncbi:MAG: peptide-methionine (S)-S-oxide reductase MsrA [Rhodobacteraceae bacterium]|nr:peptide-methionine (S)-S-oxide reductase MsrA [Paracoccaceae bacterium]